MVIKRESKSLYKVKTALGRVRVYHGEQLRKYHKNEIQLFIPPVNHKQSQREIIDPVEDVTSEYFTPNVSVTLNNENNQIIDSVASWISDSSSDNTRTPPQSTWRRGN